MPEISEDPVNVEDLTSEEKTLVRESIGAVATSEIAALVAAIIPHRTTDPLPSETGVKLFSRVNVSTLKVELCALFPSGTVQVWLEEPS